MDMKYFLEPIASLLKRHSRWNHTRIFSDIGDEDDDDSNVGNDPRATLYGLRRKSSLPVSRASLRSKRKPKASSSLPEDLLDQMEDDPLDLLDRQRTRAALQSSSRLKRKPASDDDEPEIDPEGRLIVREDGTMLSKAKALSSDHDNETRSQSGSQRSAKTLTREDKKRQKKTSSDSAWAYTGSEYTSRKAGGDLRKKDKLDPYSYWPLDRKLLNRRKEHKAVARKGMASVMKFTRRLEGKSVSTALSVKGVNGKWKMKGKGNKKSK